MNTWQANLESVRRRFEASADQYDVGCVLIHWGSRDLPIDERLDGYPHHGFGLGQPVDRGLGDYRVRRSGRDGYRLVQREHFFLCRGTNDRKGPTAFNRQAAEATRCLEAMPKGLRSQIRIPSRKRHAAGNSLSTRWVWTLFDLAWQQPQGSPRHSSRSIWGFFDGEDPRIPESVTCFTHDKAEIRRYYEKHGDEGGKLSFLRKWLARFPNRYFSHISDVFAFSAWAVNSLLAVEGAGNRDGTYESGSGNADSRDSELEPRVRELEKNREPKTAQEKQAEQRVKFCRPRREKNPPETWQRIYEHYHKKYPNDRKAGPDTLRLTYRRRSGDY